MKEKISSSKPDILSHPIVLGTMLLYFANNLLFKQTWPAQLTHAINNFAWLFFTPIVAGSLATWIIHPQVLKKKNIDGFIWFGIGLFYTAVRIVPFVNGFVVGAIEKSVGIPITLVLDPTDLSALVSLLISFTFWRKMKDWSRRSSLPGSLFALSLVALLTMADAAAEDYGISCFETQNGTIIANSPYSPYASVDGGETWSTANPINSDTGCQQNATSDGQYLEVGDKTIRARFKPGGPIELSVDAGKSWGVGYAPEFTTQAQQVYYEKYHAGTPVFRAGPLDGIIDPRTGNLVFAMGLEGVLIRKPNRTWQWVGVGPYEKVDYSSPDLYGLLWGEGVLALASGMLTFIILGIKQIADKKKLASSLMIIFTIIAWLSLGVSAFILPPALTNGEGDFFSTVAVVGTLFIFFVLTVFISLELLESRSPIRKLVLFSCGGAVLFFAPYLLWFINWLPDYHFAPESAFVIQIGMIVWGLVKFKRPQPVNLPAE
ncbi:MAG: hypothetical protein WCE68_03350 [Anaerolineales bacterium]